jgi:hypothetical protein
MPSFSWVRDFDSQTWRTATWPAPFVIQLVLGALILVAQLVGKCALTQKDALLTDRPIVLTATAIPTLVSWVGSAALLSSRSSRRRGLALSLAGSSVVVLFGSVVYALWLLH